MARYVSRRQAIRLDWHDEHRGIHALSREVHDPGDVMTGLIDKDGNDIVRTMGPIGFVQHSED